MQTEYPERYLMLGLKIAYYRKKAGYTQEAFAEKIGKSLNFVVLESGENSHFASGENRQFRSGENSHSPDLS